LFVESIRGGRIEYQIVEENGGGAHRMRVKKSIVQIVALTDESIVIVIEAENEVLGSIESVRILRGLVRKIGNVIRWVDEGNLIEVKLEREVLESALRICIGRSGLYFVNLDDM
jgi:hypothetical protein